MSDLDRSLYILDEGPLLRRYSSTNLYSALQIFDAGQGQYDTGEYW
jgi:hypothetical protein